MLTAIFYFGGLILMFVAIAVNGGGVAPYSGGSSLIWSIATILVGIAIGRATHMA
jgi:hypothetical protein